MSNCNINIPIATGPAGQDGQDGQDGQGIDHVSFTSSTGTGQGEAGETDTYTIWGDAGETINLGTFEIYNGANGADATSTWITQAFDYTDISLLTVGGPTATAGTGGYEFSAIGNELTINFEFTITLSAPTAALTPPPFIFAMVTALPDLTAIAPKVYEVGHEAHSTCSYFQLIGGGTQSIGMGPVAIDEAANTLTIIFKDGIILNTEQIRFLGQITAKLQ
jgi:hypothetical protein